MMIRHARRSPTNQHAYEEGTGRARIKLTPLPAAVDSMSKMTGLAVVRREGRRHDYLSLSDQVQALPDATGIQLS